MAQDDEDDSTVGRDGDETNEIQETSWFSRLGQSLVGILIGLVLVVASCVVLFWNEGRAVTTARSLTEGSGVVRSVSATAIDPANDGNLVYVSAMLTAGGPASDPEFGIKASGVRLRRTVEMFQWTEESESESRKKLGGGEETHTTYKYKREWSDQPQDSSKFRDRRGHTNPQMTYHTRSELAPQVNAGAFVVPPDMLYGFGAEQPLRATDDHASALQKRLNKPVQAVDGVLYVARDSGQPEVGDLRITFTYVPLQAASIVAQQAGSTFEAYHAKAGGTVQLIKAGQIDATNLFKEAQSDNRTMTWLIRLGGFVLMFVGFLLVMRPLAVLADVIPFLGDLVGAGVGILAFVWTIVLAPIVVAIAWFAYRPLVAVIVLVVGGALAAGAIWLGKQRKAHKAAPASA
ncbi:MAG: TMEM43 family protein [Alphaproteobacteria bacterium]|nr:TMEM43 family protein [Alphaproteobacteria bacterium]